MLSYLRALDATDPYSRARQLGLLVAAVDLLEWASRHRVDHIHGHSCADTAHILAMARHAGGPPYSLTLHGDLVIYGGDHNAKMAKAEFVCTVGAYLKSQVVNNAGLAEDRVVETCMGVETENLENLGRDRSYIAGTLHIATVARLHPAKGHLHALSALKQGLERGLDLRYTIAGAGPYREAISSRILQLGLEQRVVLAGELSEAEVLRLLSSVDAFMLPSTGIGEAWPVSVMEAMGAGLPVIASIIGATPEMIRSGIDGFLVPKGDEQALLEAVSVLAQNVDLRRKIGAAARLTAQRRFDVTATAAALRDAIISRRQ